MLQDISREDRFAGCLLGLAVGDALGTALEFEKPGSFTPITDMVGGGPFNLKPGQWTDDTSMALCLAESLIEKQGFHVMAGFFQPLDIQPLSVTLLGRIDRVDGANGTYLGKPRHISPCDWFWSDHSSA